MKILCIEKEVQGVKEQDYKPLLKAEALRAWELFQKGIVRELYFTQEDHSAVLVLECSDATEAENVLNTLPLVKEGLIKFNIMPLIPYPGFARLFVEKD
jgi:muconolactone delta-isomerase